MLKVELKYDLFDGGEVVFLKGHLQTLPEVGKVLTIQTFKNLTKVFIEFGRIYNMRAHGDGFLIQTEWVVSELRILHTSKVLPFKTSLKPSKMVTSKLLDGIREVNWFAKTGEVLGRPNLRLV